MWSQVGLRKQHYFLSQWRWWNSSWAISNPERWCCESAALNMPANLENSAVATGLENVFSFQSLRKAMPKNAQTTTQLHSSHMLVKYCSKFSKPGFSNIWTVNFQMFKLVLEKAEEPEIKLPTLLGHRKSKRIPEKHLFLLYWLCQSLWLCGSQQTVENSSRDGKIRPPYLPPKKSVCRPRSNRFSPTCYPAGLFKLRKCF